MPTRECIEETEYAVLLGDLIQQPYINIRYRDEASYPKDDKHQKGKNNLSTQVGNLKHIRNRGEH